MNSVPAIAVEDLSFRYLGRKNGALTHITFTVNSGETLLVLGPGGGGKSTLALCLNGLIPHQVGGVLTGRVTVNGQDTRDATVAKLSQTVGVVFQDPDAQFCMLRVDDEIAFGLENVRVPPIDMPNRVAQGLALVGLDGVERARIDRLSGGTRQRVALASILALAPPILVFDEPTSNLDPAGAARLFEAIFAIQNRRDRTIVIIEHRLDLLMGHVDRILVLDHDGQVVAIGTPHQVLRDYAATLKELGVWTPQVVDISIGLEAVGVSLPSFPLTVDEAAQTLGELIRNSLPMRPPVDPRPAPPAGIYDSTADLAIEVRHLSHDYQGGVVGLRDVNLRIARGTLVAVVGPNGAGKSTLARHLIGSIRPPAGSVQIHGRDARGMSSKELARTVGYVFQNPEHQFVASNVFDELAFGLRLRGDSASAIAEMVESMLGSFGLDHLARANPFTLSHGEKRRLSVATMLVLGQDILVLDEPTFGQDRQNTDALLGRMVDLKRSGHTILMITHDPRLVAEYADAVYVLVGGKVLLAGSPSDIFDNSHVLEQASLIEPPVWQLASRLRRIDPTFPRATTVEGLVSALRQRLAGRQAEADRIISSATGRIGR